MFLSSRFFLKRRHEAAIFPVLLVDDGVIGSVARIGAPPAPTAARGGK